MNVLLISLDQAKLYPPKIKEYIESRGFRCYLSNWRKKVIEEVIFKNNLNPQDTIIHARVAGPNVNDTFSYLESKGYRVVNKSATLEETSNKYKSFLVAKKHDLPCAETYLVRKDSTQSIISATREFKIAVLKPVYSQGLGKYCKKVSANDSVQKIIIEVKDIPGEDIIVQSFIPYKKLIRIIVIGFQVIKEATTFDEPVNDWKASVCMNPNLRKYNDDSQKLYKLAEDTARAFNAEIAFIDIFENEAGEFILNEINTACGFIIHDDVTGTKIYEHIGNYLVEQVMNPGSNSYSKGDSK